MSPLGLVYKVRLKKSQKAIVINTYEVLRIVPVCSKCSVNVGDGDVCLKEMEKGAPGQLSPLSI